MLTGSVFISRLPGGVVLAVADSEGQHLPFAFPIDADDGQDGHLVTFMIIDDGKVRAAWLLLFTQ